VAIDYPAYGTVYPQPINETLSRVSANLSMATPFRIDVDGSVARVEGRSNIVRQELYSCFCTFVGERVMMPLQGSTLGEAMWEPHDPTTVNIALNDLASLVKEQFPFVTVINLTTDPGPAEEGELVLMLDYELDDELQSLVLNASQLLMEATP
jgi:phage baseplate assembly protein W